MQIVKSFIFDPWPWYVAGPLITFTMLIMVYWGKSFGISATMRTMCAAVGGGKLSDFFKVDWRKDLWNLVFVAGAITGGFIVSVFMTNHEKVAISENTVKDLKDLGISTDYGLVPEALFSWESLTSPAGILFMVVGGFLVGFGTRYAGGCTSGHAISGLSNLQLPSLIAVIGFFIGGLTMTHFVLPYLLQLI